MKVGILGAGQLGRMLALSAYPLGCTLRFFDPTPQSAVSAVASHTCAHYNDFTKLDEFCEGLDVVTYEFENVPVEAVEYLSARIPVRPGVEALRTGQDRFAEKACFQTLAIPSAESMELSIAESVEVRIEKLRSFGAPMVLKTRRLGYDGKGQLVVRDVKDLESAREVLLKGDLLVERLVPFSRELSLIAVRGIDGEQAFYPLVENVHHHGILRTSRSPASRLSPEQQTLAEEYAGKLFSHLGYTGVLAIEFFEVDGQLLANEIAPRVHNTGHWTIEGSVTSQFENHIRAIMGLPLGSTRSTGYSMMVNIIGCKPDFKKVLLQRDTHLHWYGKVPREGRKVGHLTGVFRSYDEREKKSIELLSVARPVA